MNLQQSEGTTRCTFDIRVEPGTVMYHEWRDDSRPYRVGPSVWIRDGKLSAVGRNLLELPLGQWVHLEIAAGLGEQSTGTWELSVRLPGQEPQVFRNLPNGSGGDWKKLDWLGFSSNTNQEAVYYLDEIEITNATAE